MRYDSIARLVIYVQNNRDIKYISRLVLECKEELKKERCGQCIAHTHICYGTILIFHFFHCLVLWTLL